MNKPAACKDCAYHIPFKNFLLSSTDDSYDMCSYVRDIEEEFSLRDGITYRTDEPSYIKYARKSGKCGIEGKFFKQKEDSKLMKTIKWFKQRNKSGTQNGKQ